MQDVAAAEGMTFVDDSRNQLAMHETIKKYNSASKITLPVVFFGMKRDENIWLLAGNGGLSSYQIGIGFASEKELKGADGFSSRVVAALRRYWRVDAIPAGKGALPSADCPNADTSK